MPSDRDIIQSLGEDLPVGLWVARAPRGELIYANPMFGQIMGMAARADVEVGHYAEPYGIFTRDGERYPEHRLPFVRALEERRVVTVDDITIHRPDGTHVDLNVFARPIGDPVSHVIVAFVGAARELDPATEHQRAQRLGAIADGIVHDFHNLIFGIKLVAAELRFGEVDPQRRVALELIDDITERSAMLTRSLLGVARGSSQRKGPIGLEDVVVTMTELLRRTLTGVDLAVELGARQRGTVIADQSQLEQVIMNLVINARDAVDGAGRVVVRLYDAVLPSPPASVPGAHVVLEVSDGGPGIPAELRQRVFEPYFTTKPERGTGLGLATVFGIVASHGGRIEIDSGLDGRGTTVRVSLPAAPVEAEVPPPRPGGVLATGRGTVLIVDDDAVVRRALRSAIGSLGYQTVEAGTGAAAVAAYRRRRAELRAIMLDMVMPGLSGKATYLALREVDPAVAVILMSGYILDDDVRELLELGAGAFVAKPCSIEIIARALADVTTT